MPALHHLCVEHGEAMTPRQKTGVAQMIEEITQEHRCILEIEDDEVTVYDGRGHTGAALAPSRRDPLRPHDEGAGDREGIRRRPRDGAVGLPRHHGHGRLSSL